MTSVCLLNKSSGRSSGLWFSPLTNVIIANTVCLMPRGACSTLQVSFISLLEKWQQTKSKEWEWVSFYSLLSSGETLNVFLLYSFVAYRRREGKEKKQKNLNRRNIKIHVHTHLEVPHACFPSANTHFDGELNTCSAINLSGQIFTTCFLSY